MANPQKQAWQALRRTRRLLSQPRVDGAGQLSQLLASGGSGSSSGRAKRIYTGFDLAQAGQALTGAGLSAGQAAAALHQAVLAHFPAFAGSWDAYITQHGWLYELLELPEPERRQLVARCHLNELAGLVARLAENPASFMLDVSGLFELAQLASRVQQDKQHPDGPIRRLLTERHGLDPELALAVLKHSQAVPWWVLFVFPLASLVLLLVFWQALVNPHAGFFENVGGVGPVHYLLVPLLALAFIAVSVWLIKDRPRREREWREQLSKYEQTWREQVN